MTDDDVKVCLVSGGTRGLGSGIVKDRLDAGCAVATFGRSASPFIEVTRQQYGADRFLFAPVDAAVGPAVSRFAAQAAAHFGRLDALINNAGVLVQGVLPLTRAADVHRALAVNLEGALLLTQACAKVMLRQKRGHVINISSVNAVRGHRGVSVYSAAKAGLDGFTRSLARELGGRGIRVNSIAPGYLRTDMTSEVPEEKLAQIVRRTPLGRLGTIADIVGAVRFLLSPAAAFITGQVLVVDGGLTC